MSRMVTEWECSTCFTRYSDEKSAQWCEGEHKPFAPVKITPHYANLEGLYGHTAALKRNIPQSISVKFSERFSDFAIYELKQIGPKGL